MTLGKHRSLHGIAARAAILAASTWTAGLQLWGTRSLAYAAAGPSALIDAINVGVLALAALGWADLLWHDIRGRLIWPSFPVHHRHTVCVYLYAALALAFGVRAFLAAGDAQAVLVVGTYYVVFAVVAMLEPLALLREQRKEGPR